MGLADNLRFGWQRRRGARKTCDHLDAVTDVGRPEPVCPACVAQGDSWVHLRQCLTCGATGCCDSSPNRHASGHAAAAGHPLLRSAEGGEDWWWCVEDATLVDRR